MQFTHRYTFTYNLHVIFSYMPIHKLSKINMIISNQKKKEARHLFPYHTTWDYLILVSSDVILLRPYVYFKIGRVCSILIKTNPMCLN